MSQPLITPELLRRLEQLQLLARRRSKSNTRGERRSKARGQSVEFADHRNYVSGDDLRYQDWNLYGRLDKLFLKLYEEERELPVQIFLDASESMAFGTPPKFEFARRVRCRRETRWLSRLEVFFRIVSISRWPRILKAKSIIAISLLAIWNTSRIIACMTMAHRELA